MRVTTGTVFFASFYLLLVSTGYSWEAIAHYQLAVKAGGQHLGDFANLPDSWPSHTGWSGLWGITEWFAWSHAVQRTGRTDSVPNQPVDASGKWNPGERMYDLYKNGDVTGPEAYWTTLGFLVHLVQDQKVHYQYFRGGSFSNWREEHQYKEQWADCIIYQIAIYGGSAGNDGFNAQGRPLKLPTIENRGDPKLIAQAQQKFLDSGWSTDLDRQVALKAEDAASVRRRIGDHQTAIGAYLQMISRAHCDQFKKLARRYNWSTPELRQYYDNALADTRRVLQMFPE